MRILIASRDDQSVQSLKNEFEGLGWEISLVRTDAEIFDHLEELPDFLILDLETTESRPATVVAAIHYIMPSLRVIALTGHSRREDAAVVEKGVFYYAAKPAGPELVEVLQAASKTLGKQKRRGYDR